MEGCAMLNKIKNKNGFTSVYAIGFLVLVTIAGTTMLFHARRDRINSDSYLKIKSSYQAAMSSLQACEGKFKNNATEAYDLLTQYTENNTYEWFLNAKDEADGEKTYSMWDGNDACKYSARILGFDPSNFLIKIEGRGYGRYGGMKKAIASYQLKGLGISSSNNTDYALYIKKDGNNFDRKIMIIGNVYFGDSLRFNSNASGSIIKGNFKTGNSNTVSEFNAEITITKNAFFQTPVKI
jgi:hypothetical protein